MEVCKELKRHLCHCAVRNSVEHILYWIPYLLICIYMDLNLFVCLSGFSGFVVLGYWSVSGWLVYLFCVVFTSFITLQHKTRQRQGGSLINCMDTYFHIHNIISDGLSSGQYLVGGSIWRTCCLAGGLSAFGRCSLPPVRASRCRGSNSTCRTCLPTGNHCLPPTLR